MKNTGGDWIVYTDGGARGNPGPAAIGVVIKKANVTVERLKKTIGSTTNNIAEYRAVQEALTALPPLIQRYGTGERVTFFLDSLLVVEQLRGAFKVKNQNLSILYQHVKLLEKLVLVPVGYVHIPREQNKEADFLVNQALDAVA